jgi:hypothetical protein
MQPCTHQWPNVTASVMQPCTHQWPNVTASVMQPCTHQWPNVTASVTPCMHVAFQRSPCLLETETQTNSLWVPQQGLAFVRSYDVIYGGPGFDVTFGDQLREWQTHYSRPLFEAETFNHVGQIALVSLLAAFVQVRRILMFCSGGLAYTWQWRIGYKPQSTIFHNIYCQSCRC